MSWEHFLIWFIHPYESEHCSEKVVNLEWHYSPYGGCSLPKADFDLLFEFILLLSFLTISGQQDISYTKVELYTVL